MLLICTNVQISSKESASEDNIVHNPEIIVLFFLTFYHCHSCPRSWSLQRAGPVPEEAPLTESRSAFWKQTLIFSVFRTLVSITRHTCITPGFGASYSAGGSAGRILRLNGDVARNFTDISCPLHVRRTASSDTISGTASVFIIQTTVCLEPPFSKTSSRQRLSSASSTAFLVTLPN